jgi:predicted O-methyltransferase YrrM
MQDLYYEDIQPAYLLESIIDKRASTASVKNSAYWYMDQIYGWCSHSKASILIDIIQRISPQKIVEIGVWGGKSLVPMAYALKNQGSGKIYGIDPWDSNESIQGVQNEANRAYWGQVDHEAVFQSLLVNLDRFDLNGYVELIRNSSANADPIEGIDLLHIDGNHSDITSYIDVTKWVPLVNPGGWIVVDDISWYENGAFTQAESVKWLNEHCHKMAEIVDVCTWGIWVKK